MNRPTVRCVAFDAVGTVMFADPPVTDAYARIAARYGSTQSPDEIRRRFAAAMSIFERDSHERDYRTSEQRERELWREVVDQVVDDVRDVDACFDELFEWFGRPDAWRQYDDVALVLQQLVGFQADVVLASNFDQRLHSVCAGLPDLRRIRCRVVSSEVGYRKPCVSFFDALAKAAGCEPCEILMVGDSADNDVAGAVAAGLQAVLIDRDLPPDLPHRISSLTQITELMTP